MWQKRLLWTDGSAGALVGLILLIGGPWLTPWYQLPRQLVLSMGVCNLGYGLYSLSLARRARRPRALILLLIVANASWAVLCIRWTILYVDQASFWGLAHTAGEALFVGGLAGLEWRHRDLLLEA